MATSTKKPAGARKLFLGLIFVVLCVVAVFAYLENKPWKVPEEAKQRQNPVATSPAALAAARTVYMDKCVQCHGETGKGDGAEAASYYPRPTSFLDTRHMNSVTDGEIFYQISQGRKPMPSFKKRLSEEQRWQLVDYVRALAAANPSKP
jgi:mono/diheme cytochrome c family protein